MKGHQKLPGGRRGHGPARSAAKGKTVTPTPRSEPRISSGLGRAAAVIAACGLLFGAGGTAVPLPTATEILASDDRWQQPGVVVPASAALSFRPTAGIMAYGGFSTGTGPGLGGFPGISASPSSPGFGEPAVPGLPGGGGVPGSSLFVQPGPASVAGGFAASSGFAQPGPASARGPLAAVVPYAHQGLGHAYVWGGTSFAHGWDCSGFAQWAFAQAGFYLPRVSQWEVLAPTNTPRPGDLVTQRPDGPNHWAHVGIYIGDGMMISALNPDQGTIIHSVGPPGTSWYFTLPGSENIPYRSGELEAGSNEPRRATPAPRSSTPSSFVQARHDDGNDRNDRDDGNDRNDRNDNRRKASGGHNDGDRQGNNSRSDRNDGNDKKAGPARQNQSANDRDPKRDNKSNHQDSKPGKKHQNPGKDENPRQNPTPPKQSKPDKNPTPPKESKPDKNPTLPKNPAPKPKPAPDPDPVPAPKPAPKPNPTPAPETPAPESPTPKPPTPKPPAPKPDPTQAPEPPAPKPEQPTPPAQETTPPPTTPSSPAPAPTATLSAAAAALANGPAAVQALGAVVGTAQPGDIILVTDAATGKTHVGVFLDGGMVAMADGTQAPLPAGGTFQVIRPA